MANNKDTNNGIQKEIKEKELKEENLKDQQSDTASNTSQKRPRGRPRKQPPNNIIQNEGRQTISMSNQGQVNLNPVQNLDELNNRWKEIFSTYANKVNFSEMIQAYNNSLNFLNNPFIQNQRIKQINAPARAASRDELEQALLHPESSEQFLQSYSWYLYYTNYFYNTLIKLERNTPRYDWYVLPEVSEKDVATEAFKEESKKVDKIIKQFNPKLQLKTIATQVSIEGKSSYIPRYSMSNDNKDCDFFVLQKLNTEQIKLVGFGSEQQFIVSFNMAIFLNPTMYNVEQYPPFIRKVWKEMLATGFVGTGNGGNLQIFPNAGNFPGNGTLEYVNNTYIYWVKLPQDLCYTFYSDGSHPNTFPDTIGLMPEIASLADYSWLQSSLLSKGVNSILTGTIPLVGQANLKSGLDQTAISPDTVLGYQNLFTQSVSGNIMGYFSPFTDMKLFDIPAQPEAMDIVYSREKDLVAQAGLSSLIPVTDKPSVSANKASQLMQEARSDYLTRQFEQFLNNMLSKEFDLKYKWRIYLHGGIFTKNDDIKYLKELVFSGMESFFPKLASVLGFSLEDYKNSKIYMDSLGIKIERSFEVVKMEKQAELNLKTQRMNNLGDSSSDVKKSLIGEATVGRNRLDDSEIINENTNASREAGTNDSSLKEFSVTNEVPKCINCGKELEEHEKYLCDECLELIAEERLE